MTTKPPTFGACDEDIDYLERRAAYAVIVGGHDSVAVLRVPSGHAWLPGGGCLPGESAEETVARELLEELAREVRIIRRLGEAAQYFFASDEGRHYHMQAKFFLAEFTSQLEKPAEFELIWLPIEEAASDFFHECHAWAVTQAIAAIRTR